MGTVQFFEVTKNLGPHEAICAQETERILIINGSSENLHLYIDSTVTLCTSDEHCTIHEFLLDDGDDSHAFSMDRHVVDIFRGDNHVYSEPRLEFKVSSDNRQSVSGYGFYI